MSATRELNLAPQQVTKENAILARSRTVPSKPGPNYVAGTYELLRRAKGILATCRGRDGRPWSSACKVCRRASLPAGTAALHRTRTDGERCGRHSRAHRSARLSKPGNLWLRSWLID